MVATSIPEARGFGQAQAVEGQQLEGFWQDELATGGRSGAVLAVAEELVDAVPQHLVLASCQGVARHLPADLAGCQVDLGIEISSLEDLAQQLRGGQHQVVDPACSIIRYHITVICDVTILHMISSCHGH